jgi:hypothetical protein
MGSRRSDRVNAADLAVLEFIARFGAVPREAARLRGGAGRSVHLARERRLRLAGLIEVRHGVSDHERLLLATRAGLRACGRPELRPSRPSPATLRHEATLARLGARLEARGERLLSERELVSRERVEGEAIYSAALGHGRRHRPDLICLGPDGPEAIEAELTVKGAARLDAVLRAWRFAVAERRLRKVVYHCAPPTRRPVEQAIARTSTGAMIEAVELEI